MEHTDHDLSKLIAESARGDEESCKKLYESLVDKIFAYVRSRTGTKEQAMDITQDICIDLFASLTHFTYQSRAQFYSYVFVITRRKLAKQYAENEKRKENQVAEFNEEIIPAPESASHEMRNDVAQVLKILDDDTHQIVVLHHWARYTFGEIALLMNMTESGVRVRHHRALARLSDAFGETYA